MQVSKCAEPLAEGVKRYQTELICPWSGCTGSPSSPSASIVVPAIVPLPERVTAFTKSLFGGSGGGGGGGRWRRAVVAHPGRASRRCQARCSAPGSRHARRRRSSCCRLPTLAVNERCRDQRRARRPAVGGRVEGDDVVVVNGVVNGVAAADRPQLAAERPPSRRRSWPSAGRRRACQASPAMS